MIKRYNICLDISTEIETALCPSEHEVLTGKAIEQKLECLLDDCVDVDNHFVNIKGVDNISVEAL